MFKAAFALRSFAGSFLEASWRCWHSSSGFSMSQFVLFLHVIPDRLDDDQIRARIHKDSKNPLRELLI